MIYWSREYASIVSYEKITGKERNICNMLSLQTMYNSAINNIKVVMKEFLIFLIGSQKTSLNSERKLK